jgi:indole-3-glycerol phosphate synthase
MAGIIAEIKRSSPSSGPICPYLSVEDVSLGYMQSGASALSVLTDGPYFGGCNEDLTTARKFNFCPILRKDFIIDEYQVIEAKSIGADVILLIAQILSGKELESLSQLAKQNGLEVLVEVHHKEDLEKSLLPTVDLIGVNNRNLSDFSISLDKSFDLAKEIPPEFLKVSESGIRSADEIWSLKQAGYHGVLIGSHFMKHSRPQEQCFKLVTEVLAKMSQPNEA